MDTEPADLIFPDTLRETKVAMSALIGDVTELRTWIKLQYDGRFSGLRVDWDQVRAKQAEVASLQGDIDALKKHASGLREAEAMKVALASTEKQRLKAENLEREKAIQRQAMEAKNDRRVQAAERQAREQTAARVAITDYIKQHAPEHLTAVYAVAEAARKAAQ